MFEFEGGVLVTCAEYREKDEWANIICIYYWRIPRWKLIIGMWSVLSFAPLLEAKLFLNLNSQLISEWIWMVLKTFSRKIRDNRENPQRFSRNPQKISLRFEVAFRFAISENAQFQMRKIAVLPYFKLSQLQLATPFPRGYVCLSFPTINNNNNDKFNVLMARLACPSPSSSSSSLISR